MLLHHKKLVLMLCLTILMGYIKRLAQPYLLGDIYRQKKLDKNFLVVLVFLERSFSCLPFWGLSPMR